MGLFVTKDQYPGADSKTKRCLAQADLECPSVTKLLEATKAAKLKIDSPGWMPSAWAHVSIPSKKVAIVVINSSLSTRSQGFRDTWGKYGWRCFCITKTIINKASVDQLAADLLGAIQDGGK